MRISVKSILIIALVSTLSACASGHRYPSSDNDSDGSLDYDPRSSQSSPSYGQKVLNVFGKLAGSFTEGYNANRAQNQTIECTKNYFGNYECQ